MTRDTTGLIGTRSVVIPDDWEAHHQSVVDLTRTLDAELWTGADPEWVYDPAAKTEVRDLGEKAWEGLVRLQQLRRTTSTTAGTQPVTTHEYLLVLPHCLEGLDLVHWVKARGRLWKVIDIQDGSLQWERDLIITDNLEAEREY